MDLREIQCETFGKIEVFKVIEDYIKIFGNKWNLRIIFTLFNGMKRYSEIKKELEPISQTTLSKHLKILVSVGMIDRSIFYGSSVSVYYSISKIGYDAIPLIITDYKWMLSNITERRSYPNSSRISK